VVAACFFLVFPETKGKSLEEIAEIFGDRVAYSERVGAVTTSNATEKEDMMGETGAVVMKKRGNDDDDDGAEEARAVHIER